ncbi:MAG TPA: diaminopimelate epimerase [Gemmatimonadales bacterium]|nr:diaminopimelate epimerase [Gemmatimonadales bacterium]
MSTVVFHKVTGSGNDFVMLDGRTVRHEDWPAERIAAICDRRQGVGSDGMVIIDPVAEGEIRMTYWNADGSLAAMCGNAALCSTRLAAALEMVDPAAMTLHAGAGSYSTRCVGEGDQAELLLGELAVPRPVEIPLAPGERSIRLGVVGVPHLVVEVDDVSAVDIATRGPELRSHPLAGPAGANANFYSLTSSSSGTGGEAGWLLRTWERGVEGETLSCGTGTVAAALAIAARGLDQLPIRFRSSGGQLLSVSGRIEGEKAVDVWLAGQGRVVARGVWLG